MSFGLEGGIRIAPLGELAQLQECVELQIAVWGYSDGDVIPRRMFVVARKIGGQVLGAYAGDRMVGFAMALPGYREGKPYLHSHMLAVLPEFRGAGVGRRLKLAQREDALGRGIELMEWTFDPLEIRNAHLNIARLGAIARRYEGNLYGASSSPLQGGLPTDRLVAEWWLRSARVRHVLGESLEEEMVEPAVVERVEVPREIYQWKGGDWKGEPSGRKLAEALQTKNRVALEAAFAGGLAVIGYERSPAGDGCFLLGAIEPGWLESY